MHIKYSFFFILLIGFLFLAIQPIKACQCGQMPTVITSLNRSENVFIGEIVKFGKEETTNKFDSPYGATISVKKVYKGSLKEGDIKFFVKGSGDNCLFEFSEKWIGLTLLIYDSDSGWGKRFNLSEGITFCGRSANLEKATIDFLYLDNLEKLRGKTRIYGNVGFAYGRENPQGRKIRIIGKDKTYEVITDKNGIYEIYDLPAGEYVLEPEIPKGWRIEENLIRLVMIPQSGQEFPQPESPTQFPIILEAQKDASYDFFYVADNTIRGRIIDPVGKPMNGICLTAIKSDAASPDCSYSSCTDEQGNFEITSLDRGNYIFVINKDGKASSKQPIHRLFYPGVKERAEATIINISEGEKIILKDFKVPEVLQIFTLSGILVFSDGTSAWREHIRFIPDKNDERFKGDDYGDFDDYAKNDSSFLIKIFKGQTGKLRGEMTLDKKQLETCPEIKNAVIENKSDNTVTVATKSLEIKADQDLKNIKLAFPFIPCLKSN